MSSPRKYGKVLTFGMVTCPVNYFTSSKDGKVSMNKVTPDGHHRVNQQWVDAETGAVVANADLLKGYFRPGADTPVIVTDEDLKACAPDKSESIAIDTFVDAASIDPVRFDKTYYLAPDGAGKHAFSILLAGIRRTGKAAVGKVVISNREHTVVIRAHGTDDLMTMTTLYYDDEVVAPSAVAVPLPPVVKAELDMAVMLIEASSGEFDSAKYADTYREALLARIEAKAEGKVPEVGKPAAPAKKSPSDLMAVLRASVEQAKGKAEAKPKAASKRKTAVA